ncbi:HAMP domain-containing histidine kinase [Lentzea sp. NBC_00516]|uniref:sensor histidine kinase n=1 Tax=Lentzea sp. NBC_00516 TaxID=2903582 RepID=UPI002E80CFCB|nr:HAMP domain-containing sensor histidine kinase [Lentzea sp. NBC_00516]WUD29588.1 HAMP domain-containing histidine kinase [Lentzea sp. NBC_00516]
MLGVVLFHPVISLGRWIGERFADLRWWWDGWDRWNQTLMNWRSFWAVLGMVGLVLAMLIALVVLHRLIRTVVNEVVLRPLKAMQDVLRATGPQNLSQRVPTAGAPDQLTDLALAINAMLDRVALSYEGQRRFAANASHELRTPLAVQRTLVEVAMVTEEDNPGVDRLGRELLLVNESSEALIEGLLVLAESDRGVSGAIPVRLDELAGSVLDRYSDLAAQHEVSLRPALRERTVPGDPVLLERMLGNLVHNAIKYNRTGGWVEVAVSSDGVTVHNTGREVLAHQVAPLFEPFRRLVADRTSHREGAGLGLSIVRSITAAHHGTIDARPGLDGGLRVEIDLPAG